MREPRDAEAKDANHTNRYATRDPRMIGWLLLLVSAPFSRVMLYAALLYAVPYVVAPAISARRHGPRE